VSAFFDICLETIIPDRYAKSHAYVLRELDRLENEARPIVDVSSDELDFGEIYFLEPVTRSIILENTGTVSSNSSPT
jgi:hypothetical protein